MNILVRFTDNVYHLRLVSFIPGILLIPLSFLSAQLIFKKIEVGKLYSKLISLLISSFYAFSFFFVILSTGTRPYTLMLVFQMLAFCFLLLHIDNKEHKYLLLFYLSSLFAILSDYSSLMSVFVFSLIIIAITFFKDGSPVKNKNLVNI